MRNTVQISIVITKDLFISEALLLENDLSRYRFLSNGDTSIMNVDDAAEFFTTINAMTIMGFGENEIDGLFVVIVGKN